MIGPELLAWLRARSGDFVEFLREMVELESPSLDPERNLRLLRWLTPCLERLGMQVRLTRPGKTGGQLLARPEARERGGYQVLVGHVDTVWPVDTLAGRPFHRNGSWLWGPGIYDMKAGVAQMIFALRALRELGQWPALAPVVWLATDEEVGSFESTRYLRALARGACRALILEPSLGAAGKLKTARKGVGRFTVTVRGRAAHAGLEPERGISAIQELSFVIQKLFALNDAASGISVNVGTVDGGIRVNVVAPESRAHADVRVLTEHDARAVERAIRSLAPEIPGVELEVSGGFGRPPLEPTPRNQALWNRARELARQLGLELEEGVAGGGSDGNTTSLYTATLDGLGPVGEEAHGPEERIHLDPTLERTALLALLLMEAPR